MIELVSGMFSARALPMAAAALLCAGANGCASVKTMTDDFNKKWDDPSSIIAEMDKSADGARASASSADAMAALNVNDCARQAGLPDSGADSATRAKKQIAAGECLLGRGKDEEAEKMFGLAADEEGGAVALQGRGVALVRLEKYLEAADALAAATQADPSLWRAWNAYGVAADYLGLKEEAIAAFNKSTELNPSDGSALNNLGVALLKADRRDEAIAAFRSALAVDGAREAAEANLRLAYALGGDYSGAVRTLTDEKRAIALNNAGVAAATRGDKKEAKRLFTEALEASPHFYAKAYNNLSMLVE